MTKIAVQVRAVANDEWSQKDMFAVVEKLDHAVLIEQDNPREILAIFWFEPGSSLSVSTEQHFKESVGDLKELKGVEYRDGGPVVHK